MTLWHKQSYYVERVRIFIGRRMPCMKPALPPIIAPLAPPKCSRSTPDDCSYTATNNHSFACVPPHVAHSPSVVFPVGNVLCLSNCYPECYTRAVDVVLSVMLAKDG